MSNQEMRAGRFLKLQTGRNTLRLIQSALAEGRRIRISTYTKSKIYSRPEQFRMDKNGSVCVARGSSNWDYITLSDLEFGKLVK